MAFVTVRSGDEAAPTGDTYLADLAARLASKSEHEREGFLHRLGIQAPEMAAQLRGLAGSDTSHGVRDLRPGDVIVRPPSLATPSRPRHEERSPLRERKPVALDALFAERAMAMRRARAGTALAPPPREEPTLLSPAAAIARRERIMAECRRALGRRCAAAGVASPWDVS